MVSFLYGQFNPWLRNYLPMKEPLRNFIFTQVVVLLLIFFAPVFIDNISFSRLRGESILVSERCPVHDMRSKQPGSQTLPPTSDPIPLIYSKATCGQWTIQVQV